MKFQDDISNMNTYIHTYIHTDKPKPICPHFFKVGGIIKGLICNMWLILSYMAQLVIPNPCAKFDNPKSSKY